MAVDSFNSGGVLIPLFLDEVDLRLEKRRARDDGGGVVGVSVPEEGAVIGLSEDCNSDNEIGVETARAGGA